MNPVTKRPVEIQLALEFTLGWRPLRYFALYRLPLACIFLLLAYNQFWLTPIGQANSKLFAETALIYMSLVLLSTIPLYLQRPSLNTQTSMMVFIDIATITILMHASGGVGSGLGILLLVSVASGGLLLSAQLAFLFAAIASLALLAEEAQLHLSDGLNSVNYTSAGLLGMMLFLSALLSQNLAKRIRTSTELAERRRLELTQAAELNERIIQRMQAGVIAVDADCKIRLVNRAAMELLGTELSRGLPLAQASARLTKWVIDWREHALENLDEEPRLTTRNGRDLSLRFASLENPASDATLIFLEDRSAIRQKAQLMKMAALGSLSGGIAHEIRNPLGAIANAAELLEESTTLDEADQSLLEMIQRHCTRVNRIVEDILNLGRRDQLQPELIDLPEWLDRYRQAFITAHNLSDDEITLQYQGSTETRMDPSHLHQILDNICENALKHTAGATDRPRIRLITDTDPISERPVLEIIDCGEGIAAQHASKLFEPFFTTGNGGTGLGLYLARELCESNQAQLRYQPRNDDTGACFRIIFAHPEKKQYR